MALGEIALGEMALGEISIHRPYVRNVISDWGSIWYPYAR
jgi:hypothetical protein